MTTVQAMAMLAAGIHIPLALTVWSMLHRRWRRTPLRLWVGGSLAMGIGATLFTATGGVPAWASDELANALLSCASAMRIAALRLDLGWPVRARLLALLSLADFCSYFFGTLWLTETVVVIWGFANMLLWTLAFAWHAAAAGRQLGSRSGWVLAAVELCFAATMLLHLVAMAAGWTEAHSITESWDFVLMIVGGLAAALYSNLGYLGLVLDRTSAAARQARDTQLTETLMREAAEGVAQELRTLLQQRERLLDMLAHEIRQPLHNASGALQAAALALADPATPRQGQADDASTLHTVRARTGQRLRRAQAVLSGVQSVLDNTLAAASLMSRDAPLVRVDTELDFLVQLTLGDLPEAQRQRVQLQWRSGCRSADLEPGLVRLALRNLLINAFAHGGPQVQVVLEVGEAAAPPALLLQVVDDGPGVPGDVAAHALAQGDDAALLRAAPRQGLGLAIVRRVMALHGGELRVQGASPRGLVACLVFPQPG